MRYQMTRADRYYRARSLLNHAGYRTPAPEGDPSGVRTLLLEVALAPDCDPGFVARIIHRSDPDAQRLPDAVSRSVEHHRGATSSSATPATGLID
ncbi:MAG: hypothetical protein JWL64_533 [Frankiales bacterium]|nr:hypothetical protein [Frankiales bacterium]